MTSTTPSINNNPRPMDAMALLTMVSPQYPLCFANAADMPRVQKACYYSHEDKPMQRMLIDWPQGSSGAFALEHQRHTSHGIRNADTDANGFFTLVRLFGLVANGTAHLMAADSNTKFNGAARPARTDDLLQFRRLAISALHYPLGLDESDRNPGGLSITGYNGELALVNHPLNTHGIAMLNAEHLGRPVLVAA